MTRLKTTAITGLLLLIFFSLFGISYLLAGSDRHTELDERLETSILKALDMEGSHLSNELIESVDTLDLSSMRLTSLEGLEHFTSLESLNLDDNHIENLSPLEALNLTALSARDNQIRDLAPLAEMTSLTELDVRGNQINSIAEIASLPGLRKLNVRDNQLADVQGVEQLTRLTELNIRGNRISDIRPIGDLNQLRELNIRNNQIQDVSPLADLSIPDRLFISGNGIQDKTPLASFKDHTYEIDFEHRLSPVSFSHESGFHDEPFQLFLDTAYTGDDVVIYYSLDGSLPTPDQHIYDPDEGIRIDPEAVTDRTIFSNERTTHISEPFSHDLDDVLEAVTVRAAVYYDRTHSHPVSHTYFIGNDLTERSGLPVFAISTDGHGLFSHENGIYTSGRFHTPDTVDTNWSGNAFQRGIDWEREAHMQFFEADGSLAASQDIGIRIHGNYSRILPRKSLRLYSRADYGQSRMYTPFFPDADLSEFNRLLLRNSGNDWNFTMLRDGFMQSLVMDREHVDKQLYRPAIVLLNGEYWGIHNIRERYDEDYLETNYHVDDGNITILEPDPGNEKEAVIDEGERQGLLDFQQLRDYMRMHDLAEPRHYAFVKERLDVDSFAEFYAYHIYTANQDWPHNNSRFWKLNVEPDSEAPIGHDGKWRWMLFDLDRGFTLRPDEGGYEQETLEWSLRDDWSTELANDLLDNPDFETRFINVMADLLNTNFSERHAAHTLDETASAIEREIPFHIDRWHDIQSVERWEEHLETMHEFARERPAIVREHYMAYFDLSATTDVSLSLPEESTGLSLNSIDLAEWQEGDAWSGVYYKDTPVTLRMSPQAYEAFHLDIEGGSVIETQTKDDQIHLIINPDEDRLHINID